MLRQFVALLLATQFLLPARAEPLAESPTLTTRDKERVHELNADLGGATDLYLVVTDAGNGISCDWADWLAPTVTLEDGTTVSLSKLKPKSAKAGHGAVRKGKSSGGQTLSVGGKTTTNGIGTHANSLIHFVLPKAGKSFYAKVAIDDGGFTRNGKPSDASIRFQVHTSMPKPPKKPGFDPEIEDPEIARTIDVSQFQVLGDDLEVTLWAQSPLFFNPTNMDIDRDGRIWVAEGVNYRRHKGRRPGGDRIVVLEDTDGDGKADKSHMFVQEKALTAPLGVAVIDNKIVVSQPPEMIVYTDVDRDLVFDPAKGDTREVLLTGFGGNNHDHSLHSVTVGPDGKWYWNQGNTGANFKDNSGTQFRIGSPYQMQNIAGQKSDDGHVYVGGFSARMEPDGTRVEIIGQNYRNSYEHCITSLGDLFQNDNDDPPACRTSFVPEYANFGFASPDGKRAWKLDMRPGQNVPTAEWRQDDPGITPAGDIYGTGSPTGIAFYENGALGADREGLLLSCEAAWNTVFSYRPKAKGAGFELKRTHFFTSNTGATANNGKSAGIKGTDSTGGTGNMDREGATLFRPSDVAVGADGALYVSDWFDPRVGGHADLDETCSGAIYRIAPKGFVPNNPKFDLETIEGQIAALKSPAVNVRSLGFYQLREGGKASVPAASELLSDPSIYIRGRAIHLLAQLGPEGEQLVRNALKDESEIIRSTAYRALRRADKEVLGVAAQLATDPSSMVRREVAVSLRDVPAEKAVPLLAKLAASYAGDRSYLEAWGTGTTGKGAEVFAALQKEGLLEADPLLWSPHAANLVWRLMTPAAIYALGKRAAALDLDPGSRKRAIDSLAFVQDKRAGDALLTVAAKADDPMAGQATWWLEHQTENSGPWLELGIREAAVAAGVLNNEPKALVEVISPDPIAPDKDPLSSVEEIAKLKGDPVRGKPAAARCYMCHEFGGLGVGFGPGLDGWARNQTTEVVIRALREPSADIAHGFDGHRVTTKDGKTIDGLLISKKNPTIALSQGGLMQRIPKEQTAKSQRLNRSLMLSASQLGMTDQDVADVVAYLKSL